jgi:2-polyprenyl-3-methyl-5-hydroxy-6-metoxy-1,4-benzoquinol methylase
MNPEKTAISRARLSAPSTYLLEQGLLVGRILDYGCGKGDLTKFLDGDIEEFDPYFAPKRPSGKFDVVVCNYVLCVLPPKEQEQVLRDARKHLRADGVLYVTVRRDLLKNSPSTLGVRQFHVELDHPTLVHLRGRFEIYVLKRRRNQ